MPCRMLSMENKNLSLTMYIASMVLILAIFTLSFSLIAKASIKSDNYYQSLFEIKKDIEVIKTDIKWIVDKLK